MCWSRDIFQIAMTNLGTAPVPGVHRDRSETTLLIGSERERERERERGERDYDVIYI